MTNATITQERPPRRPGLVGPLVLIGAGVLILMNNVGLLRWDIWWSLVQLWPVLLIAVGLDLIVGRRSAAASLAIGLLTVAALGAGVWYLGRTPLATGGVESVAYPLDGVRHATVNLSIQAGELRVAPMREPEGLLAGSVPLAAGERLERDFEVLGGEASLDLRGEGRMPTVVGRPQQHHPWDLRLSRAVPVDLNVAGGAGALTLDLTGVQIGDLNVSAGVGQTTVTLPATGRMTANVSGGVGEAVVRVPDGVGVRLHVSKGLGGLSLDGTFNRVGEDEYVTPGYDHAQHRVDLSISAGVGSIRVETIPAR